MPSDQVLIEHPVTKQRATVALSAFEHLAAKGWRKVVEEVPHLRPGIEAENPVSVDEPQGVVASTTPEE